MGLPKIGILIGPKGRGSNMRNIIESCRSGAVPADVAVVVSPKADSPAVEWCKANDVEVAIVPPGADTYGAELIQALTTANVDWICLAGYLRLLPVEVLKRFPNRILNVHPALLPKYGGKGMYGMHVHEAVLAAGEQESGCTVHLVTENYDEGPPIVQLRCPIETDETPESLALKVLKLEHTAFPEALRIVLNKDACN